VHPLHPSRRNPWQQTKQRRSVCVVYHLPAFTTFNDESLSGALGSITVHCEFYESPHGLPIHLGTVAPGAFTEDFASGGICFVIPAEVPNRKLLELATSEGIAACSGVAYHGCDAPVHECQHPIHSPRFCHLSNRRLADCCIDSAATVFG
jgi:hypothetical protein